MWGTMWSFGDTCDDYWLSDEDGIQVMSEHGFRIYEHEEFGYFFGIDGAGYNFYEHHWQPLYDARGLQWHDKEVEASKPSLTETLAQNAKRSKTEFPEQSTSEKLAKLEV